MKQRRSRRRHRWWTRWASPFRHSTLDHAQLALLGFLIAFAAFAFGGTEAWSQLVIVLIATLLALLVAVRPLLDREYALGWHWVWMPLAALAILAAWQLMPLPAGVTGAISPARIAAYHAVDTPAAVEPPPALTLTVSPLGTAHSLRLVLVALFVLVAVTSYVRTRDHVEKLLLVVFGIGCAESLLALLQIFTRADKLYWTVDPGASGMMTAGSFVNHSHFSQFVNLAIGAGVGLLFIRLERDARKRRMTNSGWQLDPAELLHQQGWLVGGLAVCVLAVCLSLSRNGILSLAIASAVAGGLMSTNKALSWRGWVVSLVPLLVFGLLLLCGLDVFYERLGTLERGDSYVDRWNLTVDSLHAGSQYPLVGAGLGAYPLVFPEFDATGSAAVATHADNDYAQLFVEAGAVGYLILLSGVFLLACYAKLALQGHRSSAAQSVFGLVAGLTAVAIHSLTDFGQRLPAVFLLTVTLAGTLALLYRIRRQPTAGAPASAKSTEIARRPWLASLVVTVCTAVVAAWMLSGAYAHYQAESWWALAQAEQRQREGAQWQGAAEDYQRLLLATENTLAWEPDDIVAGYWLNQYRWQAVLNVPSDAVASSTGPSAALDAVRPLAAQIADEARAWREKCPTFHLPYLLEGELRGYVLDEAAAADALFARGAALAQSDPQAQMAYGAWAAQQGDREVAIKHLARAVAISPAMFDDVCGLLISQLGAADAARDLAGDDLPRIKRLVVVLGELPQYADLASQLQAEADQRLVEMADRGEANGPQLAALAQGAADAGDHQRAVDLYRRALSSNYNQFEWRLLLAQSLREIAEIEAARREVRICVRLRPNDARARHLSEDLALEVEADRVRRPGETAIDPANGPDSRPRTDST